MNLLSRGRRPKRASILTDHPRARSSARNVVAIFPPSPTRERTLSPSRAHLRSASAPAPCMWREPSGPRLTHRVDSEKKYATLSLSGVPSTCSLHRENAEGVQERERIAYEGHRMDKSGRISGRGR